jgi:hypothetical protein
MASDWIPMRINLAFDPAVIAISARLGLDEYSVVGRLHRLWGWANDNLTDGHAKGVTPSWVDTFVGIPGFAVAMAEAGWLTLRSGAVSFPNFDRWNSQGAKQRILATRRKANERVAKASRPQRDKNATKEEKRIEEKDPPNPPAGGTGVFDGSSEDAPRSGTPPDNDARCETAFRRFKDLWGQRYGAAYPAGKHDPAIVRKLVESYGLDEATEVFKRFLADESQFHAAGENHPLAKLERHLSKWVAVKPPPANPGGRVPIGVTRRRLEARQAGDAFPDPEARAATAANDAFAREHRKPE